VVLCRCVSVECDKGGGGWLGGGGVGGKREPIARIIGEHRDLLDGREAARTGGRGGRGLVGMKALVRWWG